MSSTGDREQQSSNWYSLLEHSPSTAPSTNGLCGSAELVVPQG